jgi:putative Mg2+ transporter-C (MgtC) family protein
MPLVLDWPEIVLRLALTILAGGLLGLNRTERGMTAGLRTTLLVCLAASISMIQVNLLLATAGKTPESFSVLDLMRLPLGILTGMGFIGAGAIIREKGRVGGVTTAATLWLATVLGLCFGGGQHGLGLAALAIGVLILWTLKRLEIGIRQERHGTLSLTVEASGPTDEEIRAIIQSEGGQAVLWNVAYGLKGERRKVSCEVHLPGQRTEPLVPEFVRKLVAQSGVRGVQWRAQ